MQILGNKTEFEKCAEQEGELAKRRAVLIARLTEAQEKAAHAMVEGDDAVAEIAAVTQLRAEIESATAAMQIIRTKRPEILSRDRARRAADFRKRAAEVRAQLAILTEKSSKLLAELGKLHEVPFTVAILRCEPCTISGAGLGQLWNPKMSLLEHQISELEREANMIDSSRTPHSGQVHLENVVDLLDVLRAVAHHASETPSVDDVIEWYQAALAPARKHAQYSDDMPRRITVAWRSAKLDESQSSVVIPGLMRKIEPTQNSGWAGPIPNVASGTFKTAA